MCNETTKHFWYKCLGLFVNSPVMITVKSCLTCRPKQNNTIQYNTIQYNTIQYNTIQYNTIQYNTIQYNTIQYNTIQYNTIQYNTIQYNTIQYNTIQILRLFKSLSRIVAHYSHVRYAFYQNMHQNLLASY